MKTRIFGSLILLIILIGLFFVSESSESSHEQTHNQIIAPTSNDATMKSLSVN